MSRSKSKGNETLYDPLYGGTVSVVDSVELFRDITEKSRKESDDEEGAAFEALHRHDFPLAYKSLDLSKCPPPRGGVALGTYYEGPIIGFRNSTAIMWHILAPRVLGGTSPDLVYLTSSNQAFRGAEALVRYKNPDQAVFKVWDWAYPPQPKTRRWVVAVPFDQWGSYRLPITVNGMVFSGLRVINRTYNNGSMWQNEVFLYNSGSEKYHRIWSWEHAWNPEEGCKYFFFGPIIEPHGLNYGRTNRLGFFAATLVRDGVANALTSVNSRFINNPGFEFGIVHQNEHHTLISD